MCVMFSHFFIPGIKKGVERLPCDCRAGLALAGRGVGASFSSTRLNLLLLSLVLQMLPDLKADNQRLKDENGALIRVISKLSK